MNVGRYRHEWLGGNIRVEVVAGLVVALALIPEAISFAVIAGVDPKVALNASFSIAVVTAITGGRPAMISAATAAMAVLFIDLVRDHGIQYLFATTILAGVFQVIAGALRLGVLMRFVSRSVMTGFVNALAILILMAQFPQLSGVGWLTWATVAVGLVIIYGLPRLTTFVPSPLISIVLLTIVAVTFDLGSLRTVSDEGDLPSSLPAFLIPDIPLDLETLRIIVPTALALMVVGLLESLMTASLIDDITDTDSDKNREAVGQGTANIVTGFLGGMAGCAMIGQSMINVRISGARTRLSTFCAGIFLLILVVALGDVVGRIPMAALVAVMVMVAVNTFNWRSIQDLAVHPRLSSVVMVTTVVVVVLTRNLAFGVFAGVILSGLFFAWKVANASNVSLDPTSSNQLQTYRVSGQIFFAGADAFVSGFDFEDVPPVVRIDVSGAHFWDISSIHALDKVVLKYRRHGAEVEVVGLNAASETLVGRHGVHDKTEDYELVSGD